MATRPDEYSNVTRKLIKGPKEISQTEKFQAALEKAQKANKLEKEPVKTEADYKDYYKKRSKNLNLSISDILAEKKGDQSNVTRKLKNIEPASESIGSKENYLKNKYFNIRTTVDKDSAILNIEKEDRVDSDPIAVKFYDFLGYLDGKDKQRGVSSIDKIKRFFGSNEKKNVNDLFQIYLDRKLGKNGSIADRKEELASLALRLFNDGNVKMRILKGGSDYYDKIRKITGFEAAADLFREKINEEIKALK